MVIGLTCQVVYYLVVELDNEHDTKLMRKKQCAGCGKTNCTVRLWKYHKGNRSNLGNLILIICLQISLGIIYSALSLKLQSL